MRKCARQRVERCRWKRRPRVLEWIVIEIALFSGLRLNEIASLRCGDVSTNEKGGSVFVSKGKGGKSRLVKIGLSLAKVLQEYLAWKANSDESIEDNAPLIISSHTRCFLTTRALQKMFKRVLRESGVGNHRFHDLRHSYASHLHHSSGNNLRLVQKQLGHSSIRTTQIYADVLDGETEKAVNRLYENLSKE